MSEYTVQSISNVQDKTMFMIIIKIIKITSVLFMKMRIMTPIMSMMVMIIANTMITSTIMNHNFHYHLHK